MTKKNEDLIRGVVELSNNYQSIKQDLEFYKKEVKEYRITLKTLNTTIGEYISENENLKEEIKKLKEKK